MAYLKGVAMCSLKDVFGEDMLFYTFEDFMNDREYLKKSYMKKNNQYKLLYGLYVQSRPWVKDYFRGCIWDYLNDYKDDTAIILEYMKYKARKGGNNE